MFNIIVGNPPYQTPDNTHSLWQTFVYLGMDLLQDDGLMLQVTPKSWTLNSRNTLEMFKKYHLQYVNHNTNDYFSVYKDTGYWLLKKKFKKDSLTLLEQDEYSCRFNLNQYHILPHEISKESWTVFSSVVNRTEFWNDFHILNQSDIHLLNFRKQDYILFSKRRFNSYKKILGWSSKYHGEHNLPFGNQIIGLNITHYTRDQQQVIIDMFSSDLYEYWHDILGGRNSNNILRILNHLPKFDVNVPWNQLEFNTKLDAVVKTDKSIKTERDMNRTKLTGEVFTPTELVQQMLDHLPEDVWENPNLKWLDMACGNGQFLVEIKERLIKYHTESHVIHNMIYGVDIMKDNVLECRNRLGLNLSTEGNVVCADALRYDFSFHKKEHDYYINYEDGIFEFWVETC
jgi:hypothetical protein